jgi:undecaprenyl pyrophosphate phosphatase UppP
MDVEKAMHFIQIIVAVLLTVFFGLFVKQFLERVTRDLELPPPKKKWEIWKNIIQVPATLGEDKLSYLQSRSAWGSLVFIRVLIGTLANLLIALVATYLGKLVSW